MRSVVITGVTTGIGLASAKILIGHGFHVFGSVRKAADADRLKAELGSSFTPLLFDVTDEAAVRKAADEVRIALGGTTLAGLVNNAGIAVPGPVLELPASEFRRQLEVNVMGPVIVTQAFGPLLGADRSLEGPPGRIVMIGSLAGKTGNPFMGGYAASKHAIEGFSESLRRELMLYGIDVIVIGPGPVHTPIWAKAEEVHIAAPKASPYFPVLQKAREVTAKMAKLPVEDVAELVHKVLTTPHPRVRYAILPDRLETWVASMLPKRVVDRIIARMLGISRLERPHEAPQLGARADAA
jgi:NAD(P)-dependent dehydrogenase (short-subunit alcohol dehydrogenase family)